MKASNFATVVREKSRIVIPDANVKVICKKIGIPSLKNCIVVFEIKEILLTDGRSIDLNSVS